MIYITGDTHGDITRFAKHLKKNDTLFILGDFGFLWDNSPAEKKLLKKLAKKKYTIAFLDGCHENYDLLEPYPHVTWQGGIAQHIAGNIYHLQRGEIYTVEDKTFLTIGGGESPDFDIHRQTGTWWEAETPTAAQMENAKAHLVDVNYRVDYILTHAPSAKASGYLSRDGKLSGIHLLLNPLEDTVQYTRWYFGCLHIDRPISAKHHAVFEDILPLPEQQPRHVRRKK